MKRHIFHFWLDAQADVEIWKVGEEVDICHGDFQDIDGEIEQQDSI